MVFFAKYRGGAASHRRTIGLQNNSQIRRYPVFSSSRILKRIGKTDPDQILLIRAPMGEYIIPLKKIFLKNDRV